MDRMPDSSRETSQSPVNALAQERADTEFLYNLTIETRNFEINQLSSRNNFFMVFQGVLIAGLLQGTSGTPRPIVVFMVCCCGVVISLMQTGMASGAKFWQEAWETELAATEGRLKDVILRMDGSKKFHPLFSRSVSETETAVREQLRATGGLGWVIIHRFSVSRIPILTGLFFALFWLVLVLFTIRGAGGLWLLRHITGFPL
jgi:hypothetical protein